MKVTKGELREQENSDTRQTRGKGGELLDWVYGAWHLLGLVLYIIAPAPDWSIVPVVLLRLGACASHPPIHTQFPLLHSTPLRSY